jgi:diguanylate cyclase (GGDEF)-like protein
VLAEFAHTLAADFSIQETLDHLVGRIVDAVPVTGAGIILWGEQEPFIVAASDARVQEVEGAQNQLREGPCVTAHLTGEPVRVPDLAQDARFPRYAALARENGLLAVFSFPLLVDGQRLGALDLFRAQPGDLDSGAAAAAETLADVAAAYLFNARVRSRARENERELRHRSLHDPLTGLPNRVLLEERLETLAGRPKSADFFVAMLFVDLDNFKAINDLFGHHCGDQLLTGVASRLRRVLRPGDTLARLAGDEFVILCEDLTAADQAEVIAERIAVLLASPFPVGERMLTVTASVGIAYSGGGHDVPTTLLRNADAAMYQAKRAGGAQHRVVTVADARDARNLDVTIRKDALSNEFGGDLQTSLEENSLQLAYQPIVEAPNGVIAGVEALLRWKHPRFGWVEPDLVMALAEQKGLIENLNRWVITQACRDVALWRRRHGVATIPSVAINVSGLQLMAPGFTETVTTALEITSTDAKNLHLEMTETASLMETPGARKVLDTLRQLGVTLSLDDFGTGYSSLTYLEKFSFDVLKIDRTFTSGIIDRPSTRAIVAAVIELAHALQLDVVAEGVETEEQLVELNALGSDLAQGHYFSPALLPGEFEAQILQHADKAPLRLPLHV